MLVPIQTGGHKLPLVLVHGMFGVLSWRRGRALADFLGPDQPIYGIEAPGFDGARKPRAKVLEAAGEYLGEIRRAGLQPPFVILGVCGGCVMALQLAQTLAVAAQYGGERISVPLLMLVDPPGLPGQEFTQEEVLTEAAELLRARVRDWFLDARGRLEAIPFDIDDPRQLAIATEVGAAVEWSMTTYHATPYSGRVEVLASKQLAQMVDRPHWPWRKILIRYRGLRTLPCEHHEIFTTHAPEVFKWVKEHLGELQSCAESSTDARPARAP